MRLPLWMERILKEEADISHPMSMPALQARLKEEGVEADRRTVYSAIKNINDIQGDIIHFTRSPSQGYYMDAPFSASEAFFLLDAIYESSALSKKEAENLASDIRSQMTKGEKDLLPRNMSRRNTKKGESLLPMIDILLQAIKTGTIVEFYYFDLDVSGEKKYRKNKKRYRLTPYAVVSNGGRFYCIFYDQKHQGFSNYRLDKIDKLLLTEEQEDPVHFDLEAHLRSSFNMYSGKSTTVNIRFDKDMSSLVQDQFDRENVIVRETDDTSFTASIKTAITPTLLAWILQFRKRLKVLGPEELTQQLKDIAEDIRTVYD